jgi:hypothetical protein
MSNWTIRTQAPFRLRPAKQARPSEQTRPNGHAGPADPAALPRPATRAHRAQSRRAAKRLERTRDSVFFLLFGVVAVTAALGLIAIAGYHFIQPILTMLDGN